MKKVNLGLLGCGVVGGGLVELLRRNHSHVLDQSGLDIAVRRVLVRDLDKQRCVDRSLLTDRAEAVFGSDDIDIVVEVMGGVEPARTYISRALELRKSVVTANKALLAHTGGDLFRLAAANRSRIGFEASVCAGIPLIRALQHGLAGNRIESLYGILNGTTNFVLTRVAEDGQSFEEAIEQARARGLCEADPSLDLDGTDAAQKLVLLSRIAFGAEISLSDVCVESIRAVELQDILRAAELGYVVRHVAMARRRNGTIDLRVQPVLLPLTHPLAPIRDEYNAVMLKGDAVGELVFEGKGAGALPTASAVLSDIIEIASSGEPGIPHLPSGKGSPLAGDIESPHYLRFPIVDAPGVIGLIATALGNHGISISHTTAKLVEGSSSRSSEKSKDKSGRASGQGNVTILVHRCSSRALRGAVEEISRLPVLNGKPVMLRIEEKESANPAAQ